MKSLNYYEIPCLIISLQCYFTETRNSLFFPPRGQLDTEERSKRMSRPAVSIHNNFGVFVHSPELLFRFVQAKESETIREHSAGGNNPQCDTGHLETDFIDFWFSLASAFDEITLFDWRCCALFKMSFKFLTWSLEVQNMAMLEKKSWNTFAMKSFQRSEIGVSLSSKRDDRLPAETGASEVCRCIRSHKTFSF